MRLLKRLSLSVLLLNCSTANAQDMVRFGVFSVDPIKPTIISLDGAIDETAVLDFRRALQQFPDLTDLVLNSPGGLVANSLVIADLIHEKQISTEIPTGSICYSACAYLFFAGETRRVTGRLGVHQIFSDGNLPDDRLQEAIANIIEMLDRFDTPSAVQVVMLRTPPDDMYIFTAQEVAALGINRFVSTVPAQAADISATFTVIQELVYADWSAVLYRNNNGGRMFCAVETRPAGAPIFRINSYLADGDTFLEIFDPNGNMREAGDRFILTFQAGLQTISAAFNGHSGPYGYTYDFLVQDVYQSFLEALAVANNLTLADGNGAAIATYSLRGSSAAIDAYRACVSG
jgi:hypothetical protein